MPTAKSDARIADSANDRRGALALAMPGLNSSVQLTLIYGDSPFLIEREAHCLIGDILGDAGREYGLSVVDLATGPPAEAISQLQAGSLMAERRVVWLKLTDKTKTAEQNRLAKALGSLPPETFAVITLATPRQKAQKGLPVSAALRKLIEAQGQSVSFITPFERELAAWVVEEVRRLGKNITRDTAERIVQLVGRDHGRLFNEIQKLRDYVGKADHITMEDAACAISRSAEASSFDLVDAIAEGNVRDALAMLPDLLPAHQAASAGILLLGMIGRQLRLIWQARFLARNKLPIKRGANVPEELAEFLPKQQNILQSVRSSFVARKLARHARNFSDTQLAFALERVLYADRALKGQTEEALPPRLIVERLVIELCLLSLNAAGTSGPR